MHPHATRRPTSRTICGIVLAFASLAPAGAVAQTTYTWTGGGSDNNWNTAANWSGGVPANSGNTVLVFSGATRTSSTNNLGDWNLSIGRLEFASGAAAFTLSGNTFGFDPYLGSQTQQIFQNSANTQTIGVAAFSFRPGADSQINLNAGDLVITSPNVYIDSSSSTARSLSVTGSDATRRTVTIAGNLGKGGTAQDPDIYIQNNKRLLVTGSITNGSGNDGSIFIDSGVLEFGSTGVMTGGAPVVGATSGSGTAAVYLNSAGSTFAQQLEIRGGSGGPRIVGGLNTSGTATYSGNFVATNSPSDYDLKAATGGTIVVSGQRNVAGTLQVNRADGATAFGGTVEISSTATGGSTVTVVNAGTLRVRDVVGDGWGVLRGSVTVNAGAQLDLAGSSAALGWQTGGRVTSLSLAAGSVLNANMQHIWLAGGTVALTAATMQTNGGVSSPTGEHFEWGNSPVTTVASSGTSTIAGRINLRGDALSGRILNFTVADGSAATDLLVSAAITEGGGSFGNAGIAKYGAGTMKLTGSNSFTNQALIYAGTLEVDSLAQLGTSSVEFNAASGDSGTLRYAGATGSSSQNLFIDNSGITRAAIDVSQAGTTLTWTPAGGTVNQNLTKVGAGTLSYGGAITGAGTVSVEAGTLILTASNGFSQWATVVGGVLQASDFNQLGTGHLEFNATSGDSGTLRYTGATASSTKTLFIDNPGITRAAIDVTQAGTTLTWNPGSSSVNQNLTKVGAGTFSYGGAITGTATVGVEAGTLVLTASNAYSGGSTVSGGTLQVSANGSAGGSAAGLGTGAVSIGAGGQVTWWLSTTGSHTIANAFSLSGGTLYTEDGFNTFSGGITLASGSSTVAARYEDTIRLSGGLSGAGAVLFTQAGGTGAYAAPTYVLSATGSNTGTVRVTGSSGGGATRLQLANTSALQSATLDLATGDQGTVEFTVAGTNTYALGGLQGGRNLAIGANSLSVGGNGTSTTYTGVLSGSGGLTKVGAGRLTLGGANTYAGLTSVIDGELKLNGSITGGLNVAMIAILSGTGTVGGNATIIGTHSPGNSPGVQTFNADLTYQAGAVVNWELIANTTGSAGINYDQIVMPTGNLSFSGSTTLALSFNGAGSAVDWSDPFWDVNRAWTVYDLSGGTTSGLSNLVVVGSLLDAQGDALSPTERGYFTTSLSGQDVVLQFNAVPEPSTWAIALAGLAGGGVLASRRSRLRRPSPSSPT